MIDNHWLWSQPGRVDLDTGLLRAFVVTVEENHFGRAAERLFITQQALSKRIKRLEQQLGVRLFDRTNRRVELTDAGRRLLAPARGTVDAVDSVAAGVSMGEGPLRIDVLFEYLAPVRWVRNAVDRDPALPVTVSSRGDQRPAIAALRRGDFDVAFGRAMADPWPADIRRRPAVLEPIGLLVGADHELASRDEIRLAELVDLPLFFPMAGAPEDWITLMRALTEQFGLKVDQPSTAMGFEHFLDRTARDPQVATLFGLAMTPPDDRLRRIPITGPIPAFAWSVMWRRRIPDTLIDRVLANANPDNAIPMEQLREPERVWVPDLDRTWWLGWLDRSRGAWA
jgi:DNA-binding transcriptional LysR family regulator